MALPFNSSAYSDPLTVQHFHFFCVPYDAIRCTLTYPMLSRMDVCIPLGYVADIFHIIL